MAKPNILLITTDQHNAEIAGCYGNRVIRTPNIDSIARTGVVFREAYTPYPVCTPARTSIFTGLHTMTHGVKHNINMNYQPGKPALSPNITAFPELLAAAGYDTSFFGKLHARHEGGRNFGLATCRMVEGKGHFMPSPDMMDEYRRYLIDRGYPADIWKVHEDESYMRNGYITSPLPEEDYVDTYIANIALEYLSKVKGPFFTWVSFCTPHNAWDPPKPFDVMYQPDEIPMPHRRRGELEKKHPQFTDCIATTIASQPFTSRDQSLPGGLENAYKRFPEERTRRMLAAYYGEVSHADKQVGRLLDALRERGIRENTIVIFTSDHGDFCGNHWAFYKYPGLYDSLVRVPFVLSWPAAAKQGEKVNQLVSLTDIAPTLLDAAGVKDVPAVDGQSLVPLLKGEEVEWRREAIVEMGQVKSLVAPEWRYIRWNDSFQELYNRKDDPHDLDNIAGEPGTEALMKELRQRLNKSVK